MSKVVISTDSCLDEFKHILKEKQIEYMPMVYILDKEYRDNFDTQEEYDAFYQTIKEGAMPTTSMLNAYEMEQYFERLLEQYDADIVHISLSSGLSGTYDNSMQAKNNLMAKNNKHTIYVVDSLSANGGQNLLVSLAAKLRDEGKTAKQIFDILNQERFKLHHWFFINDLTHLKHGGRISHTKAIIGSLLHTKPILTLTKDGKIEPKGVTIGSKKAIKLLTEKCKSDGLENKIDNTVIITHADFLSAAQELKELLQKEYDKVTFEIKNIGPVVGSHTGPSSLALLFFGNEK